MQPICLKSITIPAGVTSIGNHAFEGCESLSSITIPEGVTKVGDKVFYGCERLKDFYYSNPECKFGDKVFEKSKPYIHCPDIDVDALLQKYSWTKEEIKRHILLAGVWDKLSDEQQYLIFKNWQRKTLTPTTKTA